MTARRAAGALLALTLSVGAAAGAEPAPRDAPSPLGDLALGHLGPGHEAAAGELLAPPPGADETLAALAGWRVEAISLGPGCQLTAHLEAASGARARAHLSPRTAPGQAGAAHVAVRVEGVEGAAAAALGDALTARVNANAGGDFFAGRCAAGGRGPGARRDRAPQGSFFTEGPAAAVPRQTLGHLALAALPFVLLGLLAWLALGRWRPAALPPSPPLPTDAAPGSPPLARALWTGLVLAGALAALAAVSAWAGPQPEEAWALRAPSLFTGLPVGAGFAADALHPPLVVHLAQAWGHLGDLFGCGGSVAWLRSLNLIGWAAGVLLLVRLGALFGRWEAGLAAAVVLAATPDLLLLGALRASYLWELVLVLATVERVATGLLSGRPVARSAAVVGGLALWTGYLAALVVVPAWALLLVVTWRRGAGRVAVAAAALQLAFALPVVAGAASGLSAYRGEAPLPASDAAGAATTHSVEDPALGFGGGDPAALGPALYGALGSQSAAAAALTVLGLLLLAWRWPLAAALLALAVAAFAALAAAVHLRWVNLAALQPLLVLAPLLGLAGARRPPEAPPTPGPRWAWRLAPWLLVAAWGHGSWVAATATYRPLPSRTFNGWGLYERDPEPLAAFLRAHAAPGDALALLDSHIDHFRPALCSGSESFGAYLRCGDHPAGPYPAPPPAADAQAAALTACPELAFAPRLEGQGTLWVLAPNAYRATIGDSRACLRGYDALLRRCRLDATARGLALYRCEPESAAP